MWIQYLTVSLKVFSHLFPSWFYHIVLNSVISYNRTQPDNVEYTVYYCNNTSLVWEGIFRYHTVSLSVDCLVSRLFVNILNCRSNLFHISFVTKIYKNSECARYHLRAKYSLVMCPFILCQTSDTASISLSTCNRILWQSFGESHVCLLQCIRHALFGLQVFPGTRTRARKVSGRCPVSCDIFVCRFRFTF